MQSGYGSDGVEKRRASAPMIAQHAPVFQPRDRVLDSRTSAAVTTPDSVADDAIVRETRSDEFRHAAITIRKDSTVAPTERLDD